MDVTIEQIREDDFEDLIFLFEEFAGFQKLSERMINTVERMNAEKDFFRGFIIRNGRREILGYTIFFFAYFTWTGKALYMDDLYIRERYRGQGLGKLLINKVKEYAEDTGCHKVRWQVSDWNHPAINFYKELGAIVDNLERNCDLNLK